MQAEFFEPGVIIRRPVMDQGMVLVGCQQRLALGRLQHDVG